MAADLTSARFPGKLDPTWTSRLSEQPRALCTARRTRRTAHRPRVSLLSSVRSPKWAKPQRNSVTAVRASPRRNAPLEGFVFASPAPAKKYPEDVRCRPPPRPRRAKRPARSSLPTRVSRVSTVTARTAARARDERSPASTGNPVRSVSRPSSTPFLSRRVGSRSDYDGSLHDRHLVSSKLRHLVDSTPARRLAHPSLPSSVPFRQTSRRPDGASPCTKMTSPIAPARRARAWTSPPPAAAPSTSATRPRESPSTSPSGTRWPIRPFAEASVIPARLGRRGRAVPRARTNTSTRNECVNTSTDLRTYDPPRPARRGIFQPSVLLSLIREMSLHRPRASLSKSLTFASPWRAPRRAHRARRVSDSYYIFVRHSPLVSRSIRGA